MQPSHNGLAKPLSSCLVFSVGSPRGRVAELAAHSACSQLPIRDNIVMGEYCSMHVAILLNKNISRHYITSYSSVNIGTYAVCNYNPAPSSSLGLGGVGHHTFNNQRAQYRKLYWCQHIGVTVHSATFNWCLRQHVSPTGWCDGCSLHIPTRPIIQRPLSCSKFSFRTSTRLNVFILQP